MIRFNIILNNTAKENKSIIPDFRAGDFQGLSAQLATEVWERITKCQETGQIKTVNSTGQNLSRAMYYPKMRPEVRVNPSSIIYELPRY